MGEEGRVEIIVGVNDPMILQVGLGQTDVFCLVWKEELRQAVVNPPEPEPGGEQQDPGEDEGKARREEAIGTLYE